MCVCLTSFHQIPFNSVEVLLLRILLSSAMLMSVLLLFLLLLRSPQSLSHLVGIWVWCVCMPSYCRVCTRTNYRYVFLYAAKMCDIGGEAADKKQQQKEDILWCRFFPPSFVVVVVAVVSFSSEMQSKE